MQHALGQGAVGCMHSGCWSKQCAGVKAAERCRGGRRRPRFGGGPLGPVCTDWEGEIRDPCPLRVRCKLLQAVRSVAILGIAVQPQHSISLASHPLALHPAPENRAEAAGGAWWLDRERPWRRSMEHLPWLCWLQTCTSRCWRLTGCVPWCQSLSHPPLASHFPPAPPTPPLADTCDPSAPLRDARRRAGPHHPYLCTPAINLGTP